VRYHTNPVFGDMTFKNGSRAQGHPVYMEREEEML